MDDEEFETIRRWAAGLLATDQREEVRAAARAILMLAEEVERLRVDVWHARLAEPPQPEARAPVLAPTDSEDAEGVMYRRLRERLASVGRLLPRGSGSERASRDDESRS